MAHPPYLKEKARSLRASRRLTIDELAERLALPRTTIYSWVKDISIGKTERQALAARRAGEASRRIHRLRRDAARDQGRREFSVLVQEPTFRDFVCMYVGEGSKRNRNAVAICNSDPQVIRLGAYWIRRLSARPVAYSFQHHADQDPVRVCAYWADLLEIDPATIKFQRKSNSGHLCGRTWRSQHGVLQVRTADTYLRARLGAWMDQVRGEWP